MPLCRFQAGNLFTASASSDYQHIFISGRFWVFWTIIHSQPFRLGQEDVIVKVGVDVRRNIFGRPP